jgi:hypothetical protein
MPFSSKKITSMIFLLLALFISLMLSNVSFLTGTQESISGINNNEILDRLRV